MNLKNYIYIIDLLRKNRSFLYVTSFFYNILFSPNLIFFYLKGKGSIKGAFLKRVKIRTGAGGKIYIGPKTMMNDCLISVFGNDSLLHIHGGGTSIHKTRFYAGLKGGKILIEENFTCEGAVFRAHESKSIKVGYDCMFSDGIDISTTDFHTILSLSDSKRINPAKDIQIGNHVWIGRNVTVLKGSVIPGHTIIGMNSMVSGCLSSENSIYAGNPLNKIKGNVAWQRTLIQ